MKTFKLLFVAALTMMSLTLVSCGKDDDASDVETQKFTVSGVDFTMVKVEPGTFTMGAADDDIYASDRERPAHQVTLTEPFYIGQTEVTQELYKAVMGTNPSHYSGHNKYPVEMVSYNDAIAFCEQLSARTGKTFTLPTEAQWEYAARGGHKASETPTYLAGGNDSNAVAWYTMNSSEPNDVGTLAANELGLYDMSGNVWEWCLDWLGAYKANAVTDPQGPSTGTSRVFRGGSWSVWAVYCHVTFRGSQNPNNKYGDLGFRVVMIP